MRIMRTVNYRVSLRAVRFFCGHTRQVEVCQGRDDKRRRNIRLQVAKSSYPSFIMIQPCEAPRAASVPSEMCDVRFTPFHSPSMDALFYTRVVECPSKTPLRFLIHNSNVED